MRKPLHAPPSSKRPPPPDARSFSTLELVSLQLGEDAEDGSRFLRQAREVMAKFHSLRALSRSEAGEIGLVRGVRAVAALRLAGAFELGRRAARETLIKVKVDQPQIVCQLVAEDFSGVSTEMLLALLLDRKSQLLRIELISRGGPSSIVSEPGAIFRPALIHSASAIILVHNHPSGDPKPSKEDHAFTRRLMKASVLLNVEVFDHIIVGDLHADPASYFSYKEARRL